MAEDSRLRRLPIRVIKWLGHDILEDHPLVRMLHESRAQAAAHEKSLPLTERPSYQIRQRRIFARGRAASLGDEALATQPGEAQATAARPDADRTAPAEPAATSPEVTEA